MTAPDDKRKLWVVEISYRREDDPSKWFAWTPMLHGCISREQAEDYEAEIKGGNYMATESDPNQRTRIRLYRPAEEE